MLEVAATVTRDGGIAMIDAPTGSGKSNVFASLIGGREIIIAVRTIIQLTTVNRALEKGIAESN
jgi:DNA excision repair protein ERCC-2